MGSSDTGIVTRKRGRPKGAKDKKKRDYTVSQKALEQRRKSFSLKLPETDDDKSYNSLLIEHILGINEIAQHADRHDINSLKSCFTNYLKLCYQNGMPISNLHAYASMGFDLQSFTDFAKGKDPERRAFVSLIKTTCAMSREGQVSAGKLNPVIGIFWQRNYDGLRNDTEQIQSIQEQEDDDNNNSSYKEKYRKLIGGGNE